MSASYMLATRNVINLTSAFRRVSFTGLMLSSRGEFGSLCTRVIWVTTLISKYRYTGENIYSICVKRERVREVDFRWVEALLEPKEFFDRVKVLGQQPLYTSQH